jgi:hypothetical protein
LSWWDGLDPGLAWKTAWLLDITRRAGVPLRVSSGFRSREKQAQLYQAWVNRGRTGLPAAKPGTSAHETGRAVDLVWETTGLAEPFEGAWDLLGHFARSELGLQWGGSKDRVHFQLPRLGTRE